MPTKGLMAKMAKGVTAPFIIVVSALLIFSSALAFPATVDDAKYDYFFLEAMTQRQKGNHTAAFELLRHCVKINPAASEAYYYMAQYYDAIKDKASSIACFKKAAELSPDNSFYQETLAQAYVESKQTDEAIAALEKLVSTESDRDDVLEMLAQLYQQKEDYPNVISALTRLENLEGKSEQLTYAKSGIYTRMGDKKAAIAEMKSLADQYPNDLCYRGLYADALLLNGQEEKALAIYKEILAEEPENNKAQMSLRAYYKQEGDTIAADSMTKSLLLNKNTEKEAKAYILREEIADNERNGGDSTQILNYFNLLASQPKPDADLLILYAAYMELKNMPGDSVQAILEKVLDIAPDNAGARLHLVNSAWKKDSLDRVISLCQAARQYNPDEMAFYYYQGMAYYRRNDNDNALGAFQNGISVINDKSDPDIVSDFYAVMGDLLYQKGQEKEAFAAYDSCLQWKDDNIGCLNNYAYYLSELNRDLDRAEQMSLRTIKAEPKNATYLDTYAWILFLQKRYAESKIYIDQALQNDSSNSAVITEHAGDIYYANNDEERAVELWRQAAEDSPDNALLARKIKQRKYIKK